MEIKYMYWVILSLVFIKIAVIDWREHSIYDKDIALTTVLIAGYNIYAGNILDTLLGGLLGLVTGAIIFLAARWYFKHEAFGQGDVLLLVTLGLFFGKYFIDFFAISTCISGFLILPLITLYPALHKKEIPMAPIYITWSFILCGAGYPSFYDMYVQFAYYFCWSLYKAVMFFII